MSIVLFLWILLLLGCSAVWYHDSGTDVKRATFRLFLFFTAVMWGWDLVDWISDSEPQLAGVTKLMALLLLVLTFQIPSLYPWRKFKDDLSRIFNP